MPHFRCSNSTIRRRTTKPLTDLRWRKTLGQRLNVSRTLPCVAHGRGSPITTAETLTDMIQELSVPLLSALDCWELPYESPGTLRLALMEQLLCMRRSGKWWHHSYTYDPQSSNRKWIRDGGRSRNLSLPPGLIPVDRRENKSAICCQQSEKKQRRRGNAETHTVFPNQVPGPKLCVSNHKQVLVCLHCQMHLYSFLHNMTGSASETQQILLQGKLGV